MENLIEILIKQFNLTKEDSVIAVLFAIIGFSVDAYFFPAGLSSAVVAFLTGVGAVMIALGLKNRWFFVQHSLNKVERLVAQGKFTPVQGEYYKRRILENWMENTSGISPEKDAKQLPPKPEP